MQSLRMTKRDWRTGELRFLLFAIVIAVAAISSVGFFVDRMHAALERDAHQLLGADLLIRSDFPIPEQWLQKADAAQLATAQTVVFPSMAIANKDGNMFSLLASVKAVSDGYPLRGQIRLRNASSDTQDVAVTDIPQAGTVWVDPQVLSSLQLQVGDSLELGEKNFQIAGVISVEPDRGGGFVNLAPRIMLPLSDLQATGLVQYGSRVTYRLLLAGNPEAVEAYRVWIDNLISDDVIKGVRIDTIDSSRPAMRQTLDRAEQFLSLVSLLAAMLAAVAIAMAARQFMLKRVQDCAMLRCLGMTQSQVTRLYVTEFGIISLVGSSIGVAIGFAAHYVLVAWLGSFLPTALPPVSVWPGIQGIVIGVLLLFGFALPPILQLKDVPYNQVIRQDRVVPRATTWVTYVFGGGIFAGLLLWQISDQKLAVLTGVGFLGGLAIFALCTWLALILLKKIRPYLRHQSWQFAVTGLQRRVGTTMLQVIALSLGLMALLLLTVIRGDLVDAWLKATPADAPNRFIINIQPDQQHDVENMLTQAGVKDAELYPMIRGRLISVNDQIVTKDNYQNEEAQRLVDREFNLSTMSTMQSDNSIVAGKWFDDTAPEASVEDGLAKKLGLRLGDKLVFDIAGAQVEATITSLRQVKWESMHANFFVIINPSAMQDMPQSLMTAFHLPADSTQLDTELVRQYPNLTVVDLSSLLQQIRGMAEQVIAAVEFLFLFTLASGVLVLYAALMGSHVERVREAALFRALGATKKQILQSQWIEFGLTGALSGLLASTGAAVIGYALAKAVFKFDWIFSPTAWAAGVAAGIICALLGGWLGIKRVVDQPPLQILREA